MIDTSSIPAQRKNPTQSKIQPQSEQPTVEGSKPIPLGFPLPILLGRTGPAEAKGQKKDSSEDGSGGFSAHGASVKTPMQNV